MSLAVVLDAGPLGMLSNPQSSAGNDACTAWLQNLIREGTSVFLPEVVDYEVRRELLRARKIDGLHRLDYLKATLIYLPINTRAILKAAELWAADRNSGRPSADDKALDCDVILRAQAQGIFVRGYDPLIATTNVKHFDGTVPAKLWYEIHPGK